MSLRDSSVSSASRSAASRDAESSLRKKQPPFTYPRNARRINAPRKRHSARPATKIHRDPSYIKGKRRYDTKEEDTDLAAQQVSSRYRCFLLRRTCPSGLKGESQIHDVVSQKKEFYVLFYVTLHTYIIREK